MSDSSVTTTDIISAPPASVISETETDPKLVFDKNPPYPAYLPDYSGDEKWPPLQPFDHVDPGSRAQKSKSNLLKNAKTQDLNPYLGTIIEGVQLSQLSNEGLDELALYTAERKLLVFRDQDFKDIGPEKQMEIVSHFGPLHKHPTAPYAAGYPPLLVVYRDAKHNIFKGYRGNNQISQVVWHSDLTYELQPPGTTFFWILDQPNVGGDTLFLSQVEAYNRLSDEFKGCLEGLKAVHSGLYQADFSRSRGMPIRRDPIETEHPIVRRHPVTGEKALFVNEAFTRRIVGFKDEESQMLLKFLYDHIAKGADFQARATYKPGTVVIWDNRVTAHSIVSDIDDRSRRHAVRLTPQAEAPISASA